jgi:hypothetical protein
MNKNKTKFLISVTIFLAAVLAVSILAATDFAMIASAQGGNMTGGAGGTTGDGG